MKTVNEAFIEAVKNRTIKSCELFEFTLKLGTSYYFTDHNEDIDWGTPSKRYKALPIQREPVNVSLNLEVDTVELQLAGITSELFNAAMNNQLDGVQVTIKRAMWDQNSASGFEFIVFIGTGTPTFNRNILILTCSSILNSLNVVVPRNCFQQPCNYILFGSGCELIQSDYVVSSTATADATNDYEILDSTFTPPPGDTKKYNLGELRITSGDNVGCRRTIINTEAGKLIVSVPFPSKILVGVTFDYYPGCDKTPEVCRDRFNNIENFYGFVYLPAPEESM